MALDRVRGWLVALIAACGWEKRECSVRPLGVVVSHVAAEHVLEVAAAEDQQQVEALGADGAHEPLRVGVRLWRSDRRLDHLDPFAAEDFVEAGAELAVAIVDQEPCPLERTREAEVAACWVTQAPVWLVVQQARWTRRLSSSMKNST